MSIIYMRIREFSNIKNQEYKFSNKYNFKYNESENSLEVLEKKCEEVFYADNITSINAIIGKNGSGKTSVLESLMICLEYKRGNLYNSFYSDYISEYILVWESETGVINVKTNINNLDVICNFKAFECFFESEGKKQEILDFQLLYYSNHVDTSNKIMENAYFRGRHKKMWDVSTINYINSHRNAYTNDILNVLALFSDKHLNKKDNILEDEIKIPEDVTISLICDSVLIKRRLGVELRSFNDDQRYFIALIYNFQSALEEKLENINKFIPRDNSKLLTFLENKKIKEYETVDKLLDEYFDDNYFLEKISDSIEDIKFEIKCLKEFSNIFRGANFESRREFVKTFEVDSEDLRLFLRNNQNRFFLERIKLKWGALSSGEMTLLTIVSRIYTAILKYKKKKSFLIVLDEPEKTLHPEWQRKFLYILFNTISTIYPNKIFNFLLTSHSPFIASDIPRNNIIFLDKDSKGNSIVIDSIEKKQTFGSNIHSLLTDSFFLTNTIGLFAEKHIEKTIGLIDSLNENSKLLDKEKIKRNIEVIGEPIIKRRLLDILDEKIMINNIYINDKISELENKINKLENKDYIGKKHD